MNKLEIDTVGMCATPLTQEELQDRVAALNSIEATHAMMFTWNYLASVIDNYNDVPGHCPCCGKEIDDE